MSCPRRASRLPFRPGRKLLTLGLSLVLLLSTAFTAVPVRAAEKTAVPRKGDRQAVALKRQADLPSRYSPGDFRLPGTMRQPVHSVSSPQASSRKRASLRAQKALTKSQTGYYYSQLNALEKAYYAALLQAAATPFTTTSVQYVSSGESGEADGLSDDSRTTAYLSVLYDHPELYWLWMAGVENPPVVRQAASNEDGSYSWSLRLDYAGAREKAGSNAGKGRTGIFLFSSQADWEEKQAAFDQAADQFLSDIDLTEPAPVIALQIHDRLISRVSYEDSAAEDNAPFYHAAHTAYGALVQKKAVCDGYALAYLYLLKKAGISSIFIPGVLTVTLDSEGTIGSSGGHAWNMVMLGGYWYETDPTWDDDPSPAHRHDYYDLNTGNMFCRLDKSQDPDGVYVWHQKNISLADFPEARGFRYSWSYMRNTRKKLGAQDPWGTKALLAQRSGSSLRSVSALTDSPSWNLVPARSAAGKLTAVYAPQVLKVQVSLPAGTPLTLTHPWSQAEPWLTVTRKTGAAPGALTCSVTYDNLAVSTCRLSLSQKVNVQLSQTVYSYNGRTQRPQARVTNSGGLKLAARNYKTAWAPGRKLPGKYAVQVTPLGSYAGPAQVRTFTIRPQTTRLRSVTRLKRGRRSLRVTWSGRRSGVSGYEVQYSRRKDFRSARLLRAAGWKTRSLKTPTLKKGTWYVRVRTYYNGKITGAGTSKDPGMKQNGRSLKVTSSWSSTRAIRIS